MHFAVLGMAVLGESWAEGIRDGVLNGAPAISVSSVSSAVDTMASTLPSVRTLSKLALGGAQVLLGGGQRVLGGTPETCSNPQLSCHNTTAVQDLCCFNAPGGQLLQTQFWDTDPATGPDDSWTIHGLWCVHPTPALCSRCANRYLDRPDHCDGTFDSNCDSSRAYTNISAIIQKFGKTDLLSYMQTYWKDYQGEDETFWEHEWGKHGTCISTLNPECYSDHTATEEVVDFFQKTVDLFKSLPSYEVRLSQRYRSTVLRDKGG